jgi:protein-disulfide isomerase
MAPKVRARLRGPLWMAFVLTFWWWSACRGNQTTDQAASSASGSGENSAAGSSGGTPILPVQPRVDSAGELCLGGERGAPVKLEIFSDYQCPRCGEFYLDTIKPLLAEYSRTNRLHEIYVVYHDFPLDMHAYARKAACIALAAARISRERWLRVTDVLYLEQAQWSQDGNIEAALSKVMDPAEVMRMASLAADPAIEAAVRDGVLLGQSREITSTPTFFITAKDMPQQRVAGWVPYATLKDYLDRTLKR